MLLGAQSSLAFFKKMATPRNTFTARVLDGSLIEFVKSDGTKFFRFPKIHIPLSASVFKSSGSLHPEAQFSKTSEVVSTSQPSTHAEGEYFLMTSASDSNFSFNIKLLHEFREFVQFRERFLEFQKLNEIQRSAGCFNGETEVKNFNIFNKPFFQNKTC